MKTSKLNQLIGGSPSQFTPAINNITGKYPKKDNVKVIIGKPNSKKDWKPKPGYKPSTGEGVGM